MSATAAPATSTARRGEARATGDIERVVGYRTEPVPASAPANSAALANRSAGLSPDFLTEFVNGRWHGIDIATDYDNTGQRLRLSWHDTGPDNFIFYRQYPGGLPCR